MISVEMVLDRNGMIEERFVKRFRAQAFYLQEGDNYEPWTLAPWMEVTKVIWKDELDQVLVFVECPEGSMITDGDLARHGWLPPDSTSMTAFLPGSGQAGQPYTWATVPLGYCISGKGYVTGKRGIESSDEIIVQFVTDEGSLFPGRYEVVVHQDGVAS